MPDLTPDWPVILRHLVQMGLAYALALPIAWDRERHERTAGLRTFPLVAVAACGYTLTGMQVLTSTDAEARVMQGLITGMGFIGGGAILKERGRVTGTATAASIWGIGAVGMSVAVNRIEIAIIVSVTTFLTLRALGGVKRSLHDGQPGKGRDGSEGDDP